MEIAAFNAASLDAAMTRRVFQEHNLQAACSLGLTLDRDISSDSAEVCRTLWSLTPPMLARTCTAGYIEHNSSCSATT